MSLSPRISKSSYNGLTDTHIHVHEDFRVISLNEHCLIILGEQQRFLTRNPLMITVLRAVENGCMRSDLVQRCSQHMDIFQCEITIDHLIAQAYLTETWPNSDTAQSPTTIRLYSYSNISTRLLEQMLAQRGIEQGEHARLQLLIVEDYLQLTTEWISEHIRSLSQPTLLVKPSGRQLLIGPLLQSDNGPCPSCLQYWVRQNRPVEMMLARLSPDVSIFPPSNEQGLETAYSVALHWVERYLANDMNEKADQIISIELDSHKMETHVVQKRPQCPECGNPEWMSQQALTPLPLSNNEPRESREGGYRVISPEQTWLRYKHLISPVSGAICYLHTMPDRHREDRPVYAAGYLVSPQEIPTGNNFDKLCAGKGRTATQARTSALCEALERFSGVFQGDEYRKRGSMQDFNGAAIHFNALQNFSEVQFAERNGINSATEDRRRQVPQPFTKTTVIDWTVAWNMVDKTQRWVPFNYCFAEAPTTSGLEYGIHNPNGVAAGNCREEAIIQGFLELVERDATAIWWYNMLPRPSVPPSEEDDPFVSSLRKQYQQQGWDLWLLDLTTDLGIPVCAALAHNQATDKFAIGFGCHFEWPLAIERALTELNQLHDLTGRAPNPWDHENLPSNKFLFPSDEALAAPAKPISGSTLLQLIEGICDRLYESNMELLVVDKTRPAIGLPVTQVIVPGLRHFWPRLGKGRLYDVPVSLGWLPAPKIESELNRVPLFL